jgi:hypothetical protein
VKLRGGLGRVLAAAAVFVAAAAANAGEAASAPSFAELNGAQIRGAISGKYVTDDHHWAHRYLADGRLTRIENGRVRSGQWSIRGNQLCFTIPDLGADPMCFVVRRRGTELQYVDDRDRVVWQGFVRSRTALFNE